MKEIILPIGVLAVLASMIVPLPPMVVDFLLVGNLIFALLLMGSALYISDPVKLSSLPTILLLSTLYRLSLNVTTTRLILGSGDAGRMIEAFGEAIMQGNLVVGLIVFLVITLVQFIVVAKGSERVAEVSARFTLDALPGKQMSIDADLRSGLLDRESAKAKRNELQIESRFYGALDGAMKFVKGDAIAGLVITFINIIGGFVIGVAVVGMDVGTAVSKYTLLTVGDGMLSQIPALLNSLAAGMLVTRVVSQDNKSISQEMIGQLGELKKARILAGGMALLLSLAPGAPMLPFLLIGVFLIGSTIKFSSKNAEPIPSAEDSKIRPAPLFQVKFHVDPAIGQKLIGTLETRLVQFLQEIYLERGFLLPIPEFRYDESLKSEYRIMVRGVEEIKGGNFADAEEFLKGVTAGINKIISSRPLEFVDDMMTRRLLDHFEEQAPELVAAVVPNTLTLTQLTLILKELVREGVPLSSFDIILQAVSENAPLFQDQSKLLEQVRVALKRTICNSLGLLNNLKIVQCDPLLDLYLCEVAGSERTLSPSILQNINAQILEMLEQVEGGVANAERLVLVCAQGARKMLWTIAQQHRKTGRSGIRVLAREEMLEELTFDYAGTLKLSESDGEDLLSASALQSERRESSESGLLDSFPFLRAVNG